MDIVSQVGAVALSDGSSQTSPFHNVVANEGQLNVKASDTTPDGVLRKSTLTLFGIDSLTADIFTYTGKFPPQMTSQHSISPLYEIAVLKHDFRISTLFPDLAQTPFDQVVFTNVMITRQTFAAPNMFSAGLHFEGDLTLDEKCGDLHGVLSEVLGIKDPALHLYCALGVEQDWGKPLRIPSFTIEGSFREISVASPCEGVTMSSIGIRLLCFQSTSYNNDGSLTLTREYGFSVFGTLDLKAQKWANPLKLSYNISKSSSSIRLSAEVNCDWEDAFGINNLILREIGISAEVQIGKPLSALTFDVEATLEVGSSVLSLFGTFSLDGQFSVGASIEDFNWTTLAEIYDDLFDHTVTPPDVNIEIGRATLIISDETGFSMDIQNLKVGDFPSASGTVEIGPQGIFLRAVVHGEVLKVGEFHVSNPIIQVSFVRKSNDCDLIISGDLSWKDFMLKVDLHLYSSEDDSSSLEYTVCGRFVLDNPGHGIRFDSLVPALKNCPTLGGVTLEDAAMVVASRDEAGLPAGMKCQFPIRKGFFVCAVIGELDVLSSAMGGSHPTLALAASWSNDLGFSLAISSGDDMAIDFGQGVKTDPFQLKVTLSNNPALNLACGIKVELPSPSAPLHFTIDCALEPKEGVLTLTGEMRGTWENPFGLSSQLKVGNMVLSASILATGTPSGVGIAGEIQLHDTKLNVKLFVNKDPKKVFVHIEIVNLGVKELVTVARALTGLDIHEPPDVLRFDEVELYICPAGATIASKYYPQGFSFYSSMTIFGKHAKVKVVIGELGLQVEGCMEEFTLGELTVTGMEGPMASFNAELTREKQSGAIDGVLLFSNTRAKLHANFELRPNFAFAFYFFLVVGEKFLLEVKAGTPTTFKEGTSDISRQTYLVEATFHGEIFSHIRAEINRMLQELAEEAERVAHVLEQERQNYQRNIEQAKDSLNQWTQNASIDENRKREFVLQLGAIMEERIKLHPEEIPDDADQRFRNAVQNLQFKQDQWNEINRTLDDLQRQAVDQLRDANPIDIFDDVIDFAGGITRKFIPVAHPEVRTHFKSREIAYISAQVDMVMVLIDILPHGLRSALEPHVVELQEQLTRESQNGVLEDVFEVLDEVYRDIVNAISMLALDIADDLGSALFGAMHGVVTVANAALQMFLALANGVLLNLLERIEITDIYLKGELGEGMSFKAMIKGRVSEQPFEFSVTANIMNFDDFIQAIFEWLKEFVTKFILAGGK